MLVGAEWDVVQRLFSGRVGVGVDSSFGKGFLSGNDGGVLFVCAFSSSVPEEECQSSVNVSRTEKNGTKMSFRIPAHPSSTRQDPRATTTSTCWGRKAPAKEPENLSNCKLRCLEMVKRSSFKATRLNRPKGARER